MSVTVLPTLSPPPSPPLSYLGVFQDREGNSSSPTHGERDYGCSGGCNPVHGMLLRSCRVCPYYQARVPACGYSSRAQSLGLL